MNTEPSPRVVIVFGALCGGSYAAWPALEAFWETNRIAVALDVGAST